MIGNVVKVHLPVKKCKTCIHWKYPYPNASANNPDFMAGHCDKPGQKKNTGTITGMDYSCEDWEGEQRTGDEVV